jgi:hypothetical protein
MVVIEERRKMVKNELRGQVEMSLQVTKASE